MNLAVCTEFDASRSRLAGRGAWPPTLAIAPLAAWAAFAGCQPAAVEIRPPVAVATPPPAAEPVPVETGPRTTTWEELDLGMQPDSVYQPWMLTTRVKVLEGQTIRITGFMSGAIFQKNNIRTFPLMREEECPFGIGGQAHHVIEVELQGKLRTDFTTEPVTVVGTFSVRPYTGPNGKTWSLYHLEATAVE